jgi:DNA topoisomerase-6 subunit A
MVTGNLGNHGNHHPRREHSRVHKRLPLQFIGLSSADPDHYGLPRNVGIKLNDKDVGRAKELLKYPWFEKKPWQAEIKRMLAAGLKYELDALANKDFRYLTKTYLPRKLKERDWLD